MVGELVIRVLFMGRKPVAARVLRHLASAGVTVVGVLTDSHLAQSPTADAALELKLPLYTFDDALHAAASGKLEFDIGLSILYWRKLKGALLRVPCYGVINFHPAPLPDFKGVGGYNLGILEGHSEWGVSAHYMDEDIDTGPIIAVDRFPIDCERETARSLEARSMEVLEAQVRRVWGLLADRPGRLPTMPNGPGRHLSRRELEAMKRIDFLTDDVPRKVRAFWFPPYDGAYIEHEGRRLTLVTHSILEDLADPESSSLFTPKQERISDRPRRYA